MKKLFAAVLALSLFANVAFAAPQREDRLSGSKPVNFAYAQDIDSTNASLAMVSGITARYVTLYKALVSVDAADYVYLTCGGTQKTARKFLAANTTVSLLDLFPMYIQCGSGEALAIVRGAAATKIGVDFWFLQEP